MTILSKDPTSKKSIKMNNVDVLRAVAVLSVFLHHIDHVYHFNVPFFGRFGGMFGVQLFFLISGFLIIQSAERYSLKSYVLHRFFRIFPVYILVFLTFGVLTGAIYWDKVIDNPWGLVSNLLLLQHLFPNHLIVYDSLHVSWTLTIEVIWYVLAPLMVIIFRKSLNLTLIMSMLISAIWVYFASQGVFDSLYEKQLSEIGSSVTQHRNLLLNNAFVALLCYFFIGAYIYYKQEQLKKISPVLLALAFILCGLIFPYWMRAEISPNFITGIGLGSLLVLALAMPTLYSRPIKFIADISYSFYLTHFTIILVVHHALNLQSNWYILLAFATTVTLSAILYKTIEKPMMAVARKITR